MVVVSATVVLVVGIVVDLEGTAVVDDSAVEVVDNGPAEVEVSAATSGLQAARTTSNTAREYFIVSVKRGLCVQKSIAPALRLGSTLGRGE